MVTSQPRGEASFTEPGSGLSEQEEKGDSEPQIGFSMLIDTHGYRAFGCLESQCVERSGLQSCLLP